MSPFLNRLLFRIFGQYLRDTGKMFSRLSRKSFELQKCLFKYQPASALNTSITEKSSTPAESAQRDLVNFPRRVRAEYSPPVRMMFIPESWFQFFYPKTGVTGPYMLGLTVGTFLLSKEIFVAHGIPHIIGFLAGAYFLKVKVGDSFGKWYNKYFDNMAAQLDEGQENGKKMIRAAIDDLQKSQHSVNVIDEVTKAKKENVLFQMESIYRERLVEAYRKIKQNLDYQVELENVERRIAQKNLVDYVIRNVLSSITPEQEKNAMQMCINNLNRLASKA